MPGIEPPSPAAQRLLSVIAREIANGRIRPNRPETFLAFSEALELLGEHSPSTSPGARLGNLGLHDLRVWTEEHEELPKITGLIVYKATQRPHEDFLKWHRHENDLDWERWWLAEANRAIEFDWSPYLAGGSIYSIEPKGTARPTVREDGELEVPDYRGIITLDPGRRGGRPCIRGMRITVGDILGWLAAGKSERQIIEEFPGLTQQDIRASLAYAAQREGRDPETEKKVSRLARFSEKWSGTFSLPQSDPDDPRMDYLLERYWRHRK